MLFQFASSLPYVEILVKGFPQLAEDGKEELARGQHSRTRGRTQRVWSGERVTKNAIGEISQDPFPPLGSPGLIWQEKGHSGRLQRRAVWRWKVQEGDDEGHVIFQTTDAHKQQGRSGPETQIMRLTFVKADWNFWVPNLDWLALTLTSPSWLASNATQPVVSMATTMYTISMVFALGLTVFYNSAYLGLVLACIPHSDYLDINLFRTVFQTLW
jgi:hypothetical protein